jgi:hypothetical protein
MTTKLRLFTSPSAFPNPQRLRLFMHEKGIADQFEEHICDMTPGCQTARNGFLLNLRASLRGLRRARF